MSLFFNLNDIVVHIIALELLVLSLTEFFLMNFKMIVCGCSKYEDWCTDKHNGFLNKLEIPNSDHA